VVATQLVPEQVKAVAFAVGQAAQTPPHAREFALQVKPHDVPSQVAVPFATVGQTAHDDPQLATLVVEVHWVPPEQTW
jgi:hypothetical protein